MSTKMSADDTFAFETTLKLATAFRHGWAGFAEAAAGAYSIHEAFQRISDAMGAWEQSDEGRERGGDAGIRPSRSHKTQNGRISWRSRWGDVSVSINRPSGAAIVFRIQGHREPRFGFSSNIVREPRHTEAGRWVAEALGVEGEYLAAVPPAEFHEWRSWSGQQRDERGHVR